MEHIILLLLFLWCLCGERDLWHVGFLILPSTCAYSNVFLTIPHPTCTLRWLCLPEWRRYAEHMYLHSCKCNIFLILSLHLQQSGRREAVTESGGHSTCQAPQLHHKWSPSSEGTKIIIKSKWHSSVEFVIVNQTQVLRVVFGINAFVVREINRSQHWSEDCV